MKRRAYISLLAALVLMSCSRNDINEVDTPYDIIFDAVMETSTKAESVTSNDYPSDMPFGVWAYSLPSSKNWADAYSYARLDMDNVKASHISGRQWKPENGQQWGPSGENMNFFAAAPYGRASYEHERGICIDSYSIEENLQLMFIDGVLDQNKRTSRGHVNLCFTRALTAVSFRAQMSLPQGHNINVKKLILSKIMTEGDFASRPVPHWIPEEEPQDVLLFEGNLELSESPSYICSRLPMIPQAGETELTLVCDISNGTGVLSDQTLKTGFNMNWGVGKHCSYTLKVTHNLEFTAEKDPN